MSDLTPQVTGTPNAGREDDPAVESSTTPPQPNQPEVVDLADVFGGADSAPPAAMERLSVRVGEPVVVIAFSTVSTVIHDHWVDGWGYSLCPRHHGEGRCPLCQLGKPAEKVVLMPVYEPDSAAVQVMRVPDQRRPRSLWSEMKEKFYREYQRDESPRVISILHEGRGRYVVESNPVPEGVDNGRDAIALWFRAFEAGEIKLVDAWASVSDAELRATPEIDAKLRLRGLA